MAADHEDLDALFADLERLEGVTGTPVADGEPRPEREPSPTTDSGPDPLAALEAVEAQIQSIVIEPEAEVGPSPEPAAPPDDPPSVADTIDAILETIPERGFEDPTPVVPQPASQPVDDIDDLLAGEFESVSEVLADVFEDMAAFVEEAAADAPILGATVEPPPVAAEPEPEPEPPVVETTAPDPEPVPAPEPDPADVVAVETAADRRDPGRVVVSIWRRAEPFVKWTFEQVSAPMRLLPDETRRIVDWVALSLVFWVPIVWAIALLVVG